MGFEVGQQVRIIGTYEQLNRYAAGRCFGMSGRLTAIRPSDPDGVTHQVEFDNGKLPVWVQPQHLELITDDGKQSVQYPPLRVMVGDKPLSTWKQVLANMSLAANQPHLYLLGKYDVWIDEDMNESTQPYLVMNMEMCDGQQKAYYRVFVITEGE